METLSQRDILEGENLLVTSQISLGNPNDTTIFWTKLDKPGFRQNGTTLHLPKIQRNSSGTYICTAENKYSNGEKGTDNQSMVVNVLCELNKFFLIYFMIMTIVKLYLFE